MSTEKISSALSETLQNAKDDEWVDVVVELARRAGPDTTGSSRAENVAASKKAFAKHAEPVAIEIQRMGGEVTGQAWINGSLRARLAKKMVRNLSGYDEVARLDLPHAIKADVVPSLK